jgi:hypothetical protein
MSESTQKPMSDHRAVADARGIPRNTTDDEHYAATMARCRIWLEAFINHVNAQRGKEIDAAQADALIADAQETIRAAT